jgi:hypothetical protein
MARRKRIAVSILLCLASLSSWFYGFWLVWRAPAYVLVSVFSLAVFLGGVGSIVFVLAVSEK